MDKQAAIDRIVREGLTVAPGQSWTLDAFRPEDAWGVARLVHAVYGEAYPVDTPYIPEKLIAACAAGDIRSVVARTAAGDIIAKSDVFRSSPPNRRLMEIGQTLILPAYRGGTLAFRLLQANNRMADTWDDLDGLFGETVTNHMATQKPVLRFGFTCTAMELGLLPADFTATEGLGRNRETCVYFTRIFRDTPQTVYFPRRWLEAAPLLYEGLEIEREMLAAEAALPEGSTSDIAVERFDGAGTWRIHVARAGADLADRIRELLGDAPPQLAELFLNMADPWAGQAAEALRPLGFRLGGLLPLWFGSDALLLLRTAFEPDFAAINLFTEKSKRVLELVRADRSA